MNKEFVTYEQSLALKELGFNDYCYRGYDKNQMLFYSEQESGHLLNYSVGMNVSAPLKQQVFRWFREKYELGHTICPYYFNANITELQDVDDYPLQHEVYVSSPFTYEEAENACIDKLIEIAKQQDNDTNPK